MAKSLLDDLDYQFARLQSETAAVDSMAHKTEDFLLLAARETIVNRVSGSKPSAFKTQAAEQRVGFDNVSKCGCHHFLLTGSLGRDAIFKNRVVTEPCQAVPGQGSQSLNEYKESFDRIEAIN